MERDQLRVRAKERIGEVQAQNKKHIRKIEKMQRCTSRYRVAKVLRNNRYLVQKTGEHEGPQSTSTASGHMKT